MRKRTRNLLLLGLLAGLIWMHREQQMRPA